MLSTVLRQQTRAVRPVASVLTRTFADAVDHQIKTTAEVGTGIEAKEQEFKKSGKYSEIFGNQVQFREHFGTAENPVIVHTAGQERSIGCDGECAEGVPEGLRWWTMKVNEKYSCPDCGQVFELQPMKIEH